MEFDEPGGAPAPSGEGPGRVDGRRVYSGDVVDLDVDRVRFPDGSEGELEIVRHGGAAAIVALTEGGGGTEEPGVLLLRQYRYAAGGYIWEVPAGTLHDGEDPLECAHRELQEEAGVRAGMMRRLTTILTTPGFSDERIHLYLARELGPGRRDHEASEFIECHEVPFVRALEMVRDGDIADGKSAVALMYAARFADLER